MNTSIPSAPKKKQSFFPNDNLLEALRNIGSSVGQSVTQDVIGKVSSNALDSLLGVSKRNQEVRPDQPLVFPQEQSHTRPHLEHMRQGAVDQEAIQVKQQIDSVRAELAAIAKSMGQLNQEIKQAIAQAPVEPGIYHTNFYERLRSMLMLLHQQIDDSRTWLAVSSNRKQKRGYWGLYKKHGTQFGLSSERTLATQSG